jgi:hypothetical protein
MNAVTKRRERAAYAALRTEARRAFRQFIAAEHAVGECSGEAMLFGPTVEAFDCADRAFRRAVWKLLATKVPS